jgi:hypothetical protein
MIAAQQVYTHLLHGRGVWLSGCVWILQAWNAGARCAAKRHVLHATCPLGTGLARS